MYMIVDLVTFVFQKALSAYTKTRKVGIRGEREHFLEILKMQEDEIILVADGFLSIGWISIS